MPKRSAFDELSTIASASAVAKSAHDLMRGGLDDATLRAVRESQALQSVRAAAQGSLAMDSIAGTATSQFLDAEGSIAKAVKAMKGVVGTTVPKASVAEAIGKLHAGGALDANRLFPEPVIDKALRDMQTTSELDSVAGILTREGLGPNYRQLAGVVSALDYTSPMRSLFDELGGKFAPPASPASAPRTLPALRPSPARPAPDANEATPPAAGPVASAPVTIGEIGKRVRAARKAMGMTQQRFADLAGVGRRFLIELEQGKPSLEIGRVLAVCHAAGIKLGFLT